MRAAAAAAELSRARPRPPPNLALETAYVSGVPRDDRPHRFRTLLADVTGVCVHTFVDADRFGTTTAVTLVAHAAPAFCAAVGHGRAATVLRLLPAADPRSPALLGSARRRALGGSALAADVVASHCRRALTATLEQLPRRGDMPPHVRASQHSHIAGTLATHDGRAAATAARPAGVAARSPDAAADAVARPAGGASHPPDLVGQARVFAAGRPTASRPRLAIPDASISAAAKTTATTVTAGVDPPAADPAHSPPLPSFTATDAPAPVPSARPRAPPSQNAVGAETAGTPDGAGPTPTFPGASMSTSTLSSTSASISTLSTSSSAWTPVSTITSSDSSSSTSSTTSFLLSISTVSSKTTSSRECYAVARAAADLPDPRLSERGREGANHVQLGA